MAKTTTTNTKKSTPLSQIVVGLILVASLAANGFLLWQYQQHQETKDELAAAEQTIELFKSNPSAAEEASVQEYIDQVSTVYDLPEDETPSIATVEDKDQLAEQPFFERAENGDVALIYPEAELAVLYRPSSGQIVNVSTLTIDDESDALDVQSPDESSSGPLEE